MFIKSIELENFGCFKNLKIDSLEKHKIYVIYGENRDDDAKNGLGKSHFLESIPVCLYGETLRPSLKDIKKYMSWFADKKEPCKIDITLHDGIQILRTISPKEEVTILNCDESNVTDLKNRRTTTYQNDFISSIIGNFNNFKFLHYFNPSSLVFFSQSPKDKYLFVEELLGAEKLTELLEHYNSLEKEILENINVCNTDILTTESEQLKFVNNIKFTISNLQGEIDKNQLKLQHNKNNKEMRLTVFGGIKHSFLNNLSSILLNIKNLDNENREKFKTIKSNKDRISELSKDMESISSDKYKLPISNDDIQRIRQKISNLSKVMGVVDDYLKNPTVCPTCKREFTLDVDTYIKENSGLDNYDTLKLEYSESTESIENNNKFLGVSKEITIIGNNIDIIKGDILINVNKILKDIQKFINYLNNDETNALYQLLSYNKINELLNSNIVDIITNIKSELDAFLKLLTMLKRDDDATFITSILEDGFLDIGNSEIDDSLVEKAFDDFITTYIVQNEDTVCESDLLLQIDGLKKRLLEVSEYVTSAEYIKLTNTIHHRQEIKKEQDIKLQKVQVLTKELGWSGEFRKVIIENYLKDLETKYNEHISKLLTSCKVKFKLELKGREKGINIILYDGDIIKSYGELSSAEKRMVDICLLLTFAEYSDGLIVIDEALDSLSYENQVRVINLLHETNRQIFLVSHNMELIKNLKFQYTNVEHINFIKENGISILA